MLRLRDRQRRHPKPTLFRGIFGKAAPAAANLQHVIARLHAHAVDHRGVFARLRGLEAFLPIGKQRRGIGHAVIQPKAVEVIAQIVMRRDILFCAAFGVGLHPEPQLFKQPHHSHAGEAVVDIVVALMHQIHKSHQIGTGPFAFDVGLAEPQIAFADQAGKDIIAVQGQFSYGARLGALNAKAAAIRQHKIQPPALQPLGNRKNRAEIARQIALPLGRG